MKKLLPRTVNNPQGFTLIELMVAISIVAILSVIGLVVFIGAQKNARDGRRRADINAIATALETNKDTASSTYSALNGTQFANGVIPTDTTTAKYCVAWSTTVGTAVPADPTTWTASSACPAAPYTGGVIGGTGTTANEVNGSRPGNGSTVWKVCARLESGTGTNFYCRASTQ